MFVFEFLIRNIYFRANLPFQQCHHLLNPWNENKRVQISRDGQVNKLYSLQLTSAWCVGLLMVLFIINFIYVVL